LTINGPRAAAPLPRRVRYFRIVAVQVPSDAESES